MKKHQALIPSLLVLAATMANAQSTARPSIPILRATDSVSAVYEVHQTTRLNTSERDRLILEKTAQYDRLVDQGKVTRGDANQFLADLRASPLSSSEAFEIEIGLNGSEGSVVQFVAGKPKAWSVWTNEYTVSYGWQGGDALIVEGSNQPYTVAQANLPILPFQFSGIKVFTDIEPNGSDYQAKMLTVSTGVDSYLPGQIQFEEGHLATARVGKIEQWTYRDYTAGKIPLPKQILLQRLFSQDGKPQVNTEFKLVSRPGKHYSIDDLVAGGSISAIDQRSDPMSEFTYQKGKGSIIEQAKSARPLYHFSQPTGAAHWPSSLSGYLIGAGSAMALAVAVWSFFNYRRGVRGRP